MVNYISQSAASSLGLIRTDPTSVYIGVDSTNAYPSTGRPSVRLESKRTFQRGLFILDVAHMPAGCGTWPAFWTLGSSAGWPHAGEIDIIEGVNDATTNLMALHTTPGCAISGAGGSGNVISRNCDVNAAGQSPNQGCSISDARTTSYGTVLNSIGGGIFATEWNSAFIKVWFFPRGQAPADVFSSNPAPETWGTPAAVFQGACNIDEKFRDHRIIINTTFCGDWAGSVWAGSQCRTKASTCAEWVRNNPAAFREAYWRINSLKVWSQ